MIRKYTISVFSITLVLLLFIIGVFCAMEIRNANRVLADDTESVCRLTSERINSTSIGPGDMAFNNYLSRVAGATGNSIFVYDTDGTRIYGTRVQKDIITENEISAISENGTTSFRRENSYYRTDWIYSGTILDSGELLIVSRSAETFSTLIGFRAVPLVLTAAFIAGIITLSVYFVYKRVRKPVQAMSDVLVSFIEGNLNARIPETDAIDKEDVSSFNQILSRLHDKVFRQTAHNQALNTVMNGMNTGLLAVDSELRILIVTPTAKRLLGITGNVENMHISQALSDAILEHVLKDAMAQDGMYTNSVAIRNTVGRGKKPLKLYVTAMKRNDKLMGAVAMIEDITEIRRMEQMQTDFVSNVSHELRTPMTMIRGYVETLQMLAGAEEIDHVRFDKYSNIIISETDRLTNLVTDMLSISKMDSGDKNAKVECLDINDIIGSVCEGLQKHAHSKNVTLTAHLSSVPCYIMGDSDRTRQMGINLVENAIKYNKEEGGTVDVTVRRNGADVEFITSDTGIGIPEDSIDRLFERFFRVDKAHSRAIGGTGLGLSLVKQIVDSLNGRIGVQSKFGEGTEFTVTLPGVSDEDAEKWFAEAEQKDANAEKTEV